MPLMTYKQLYSKIDNSIVRYVFVHYKTNKTLPYSVAYVEERIDPAPLVNSEYLITGKDQEVPLYEGQHLIRISNPRLAFVKLFRLIHKNIVRWPNYEKSEFHFKRCPFGTEIHHSTKIGRNFSIGLGCSIGEAGFGYVQEEDGTLLQYPHVGKLIIGDNVELGSNICINRGTLSNTTIGDGTKIDNFVHIGHNVTIGKNCQIIAGTVICGSVTIGDNVWVGGNSSIREYLTVGDNSVIGLGAVVIKNVEANTTVVGNPARPM